MLGIKPEAAGSGSKYAKHCAVLFQILPNLNFNDEVQEEVFNKYSKKNKAFHSFCRGLPGTTSTRSRVRVLDLITENMWPSAYGPLARMFTTGLTKHELNLNSDICCKSAEPQPFSGSVLRCCKFVLKNIFFTFLM